MSPTGAAAWAAAESTTPLSDAACASLADANSNAVAGDIVYLRGGTYTDQQIRPSNSGTLTDPIVYEAYNDETVVLTGAVIAIWFRNRDWIKVDGVTASNVERFLLIDNHSDHNEIANCHFDTASVDGIQIWGYDGGTDYTQYSTHNWVHDCEIHGRGLVSPAACNDVGSLIQVGSPGLDYGSNSNTFENNVLYHGGHHVLETFTMYNVIRNNVFHNEGWMADPGGCPNPPDASGLYGNRNVQIYDGDSRLAVFNLFENNRVGHAGQPPDDDGAHNLVLTSARNIVRYNFLFNANGDGLYFKQGAGADSDNNRAYNNTIYHNGQGPDHQGTRRNGIAIHELSTDNVIKNNLVYDSFLEDIMCIGGGCSLADNDIDTNWLSTDGDPAFVNPDVSDKASTTLPDLSLQASSGAIDGGIHLTETVGAGTDSTTLVVGDASYFQDGTWGAEISAVEPDRIAIGTVSNTVQVATVDYDTHTITLAAAMSWSDGAPIWLANDSAGRAVLVGAAPDLGADEYGAQAGGGGTGGTGGSSTGGGGTGGTSTGGTGTGGASPPAGTPEDDSGCGCRLEAARRAGWRGWVLLALAFAWRRRSSVGRPASRTRGSGPASAHGWRRWGR